MTITKFIGLFLMMCIFIQCNSSNENLSLPSTEKDIIDNTETETPVTGTLEQADIQIETSFFSKT